MTSSRILLAAAVLAALPFSVVAGCGGGAQPSTHAAATRAPGPPPLPAIDGNLTREAYAGSDACAPCHASIYASWSRSAMHRMSRVAKGAEIHAPFDGARFVFKHDVATLEQEGGERYVRLEGGPSGARRYRVTRVIGGHHREDFAGVAVSDRGEASRGEELVLPVSFLLGARTLRYKGYSVMVHERPDLEAGPAYARVCILCHNTAPYLDTLLGELGKATSKPPRYQGEVVDRLLPDDRRWTYAVRDEAAAGRALEREIAALGGSPLGAKGRDALVLRASETMREDFDSRALIETGIGCESCHGGARAHAASSGLAPSFEPRASWLAITEGKDLGAPSRASGINHACARCHQVLFSRYPFTWEGGRRHALPGGSHISSGEGRDFLLSRCSSALACTDCHDPHATGGDPRLKDLETPEGNAICLRCHGSLADPVKLAAHSHHSATGAAGACVACHMPRKNMALDDRLSRYHRIGSPTDPLRVLGDRPLECALCHEDKSVRQIVETMERWWSHAYDREALTRLYGDLDARVLPATLARGKPHEQAVALFEAGASRDRTLVAGVAREVANEYPLVREYARDALGKLLGKDCKLPLESELPLLEQATEACLRGAGFAAPSWPALPPAPSREEPPED